MTLPYPLRLSLDITAVPAQPTGVGRYITELARGLLASPDAVNLYSPHYGGPRPARLLWEQTLLPHLLLCEGIQVHHGPHYTMPLRTSVPTVVTIHDLTFIEQPGLHQGFKATFFQWMIPQAVKRATKLIAVSQDTANRVQERFGPVDITVIPHGINHRRFTVNGPTDEKAKLHKAGIPDHYIAFVGTIEPRKNLPRLIKAFDSLAAVHPSLHLVIAGQRGWGLDSFDDALLRAKNRDRIILTGYFPDRLIPALYRHAAAVAYPSLTEGFGLPVIEALACGAPLVCGSGSALDELTDAAIVVNQYDSAALADGLAQAVEMDYVTARVRGVNAARPFSWESAVQKHIEVYHAAADSR